MPRSNHYDYDDEWLHQQVVVAEPFASLFGLSDCKRYELLACMGSAMHLPLGDLLTHSQHFLDALYGKVLEARRVTASVDPAQARTVIKNALHGIEDSAVLGMLTDFGWDDVKIEVTSATVYADFRALIARRLGQQVQVLLRRLDRAARNVA